MDEARAVRRVEHKARALVRAVDRRHDAGQCPLKWTTPWLYVTALRRALRDLGQARKAKR